jgi:hypothetical protein
MKVIQSGTNRKEYFPKLFETAFVPQKPPAYSEPKLVAVHDFENNSDPNGTASCYDYEVSIDLNDFREVVQYFSLLARMRPALMESELKPIAAELGTLLNCAFAVNLTKPAE